MQELIFRIRLEFAEANYRLYMRVWDAAKYVCELSLHVMRSASEARQRAHEVRIAVMQERIDYLKQEHLHG